MTAAHTARLAELEKLCFSEPWSEKALLEEIQNPAAYFVTAAEGESILGYGGMHTVLGESYIDNIAVFPEYRGQGVGRAVTQAPVSYTHLDVYKRQDPGHRQRRRALCAGRGEDDE